LDVHGIQVFLPGNPTSPGLVHQRQYLPCVDVAGNRVSSQRRARQCPYRQHGGDEQSRFVFTNHD
jgi:hypothetical protein